MHGLYGWRSTLTTQFVSLDDLYRLELIPTDTKYAHFRNQGEICNYKKYHITFRPTYTTL
jgi:hypothetical protein